MWHTGGHSVGIWGARRHAAKIFLVRIANMRAEKKIICGLQESRGDRARCVNDSDDDGFFSVFTQNKNYSNFQRNPIRIAPKTKPVSISTLLTVFVKEKLATFSSLSRSRQQCGCFRCVPICMSHNSFISTLFFIFGAAFGQLKSHSVRFLLSLLELEQILLGTIASSAVMFTCVRVNDHGVVLEIHARRLNKQGLVVTI